MLTERTDIIRLYEGAACSGDSALFSSPSRTAHDIALKRCTGCPVAQLCYMHVDPEDGYTGTVAGRLYYNGKDVTADLGALPPPVYANSDVNPELVAEVEVAFVAEDADWSVYNASTLMAAVWLLRKRGYRPARISRVTCMTKERVIEISAVFDEEASPDLKDFLLEYEDASL